MNKGKGREGGGAIILFISPIFYFYFEFLIQQEKSLKDHQLFPRETVFVQLKDN